MKLLKIKLMDGEVYTFQTFTCLETRVQKKIYEDYQDTQEEILKIQFETDTEGKLKRDSDGDMISRINLSKDEKEKLRNNEDKSFEFGIDIVRKSICKNHKEFQKSADEKEDGKTIEKLMGLIDITDIQKIVQFAFTGTFQRDDEDVIDLTVSAENA